MYWSTREYGLNGGNIDYHIYGKFVLIKVELSQEMKETVLDGILVKVDTFLKKLPKISIMNWLTIWGFLNKEVKLILLILGFLGTEEQ